MYNFIVENPCSGDCRDPNLCEKCIKGVRYKKETTVSLPRIFT